MHSFVPQFLTILWKRLVIILILTPIATFAQPPEFSLTPFVDEAVIQKAGIYQAIESVTQYETGDSLLIKQLSNPNFVIAPRIRVGFNQYLAYKAYGFDTLGRIAFRTTMPSDSFAKQFDWRKQTLNDRKWGYPTDYIEYNEDSKPLVWWVYGNRSVSKKTYTYDSTGLLKRDSFVITFENKKPEPPNITTYEYDQQERLIRRTKLLTGYYHIFKYKENQVSEMEFDKTGGGRSHFDKTYNPEGQLVESEYFFGKEKFYYNEEGKLSKTTNTNTKPYGFQSEGDQTINLYIYDQQGLLTRHLKYDLFINSSRIGFIQVTDYDYYK